MKISCGKRYHLMTLLFGVVLLIVYALTCYGGLRSPDSEIVFRTAESLVTRHQWDVPNPVESWPEFGLATGIDGKKYSVFGPLQSILAAPLVAFGKAINPTPWYAELTFTVPPSHLLDYGFDRALKGMPISHLDGHALRFVTGFFNSFVSAASAIMIWWIAVALWNCVRTAATLTFMYALGTLAWPYSGTFFSEPLATFFALSSLYFLIRWHHTQDRWALALCAGFSLGLSTATHITSILFVPFFAAAFLQWPLKIRVRDFVPISAFLAGLCVVLALLGWYNYARFGNPLETGRSVDPVLAEKLHYGHWIAPTNLPQLLVGPAKGLLLFCPLIAVAIVFWPAFFRTHRRIAIAILAASLIRIVFIASRSDWHGGFCLGPRYLVAIIPMLLLPLGSGLHRAFSTERLAWIRCALAAGFLAAVQQAYFVSTEIFGYLYLTRLQTAIENFRFGTVHDSWRHSPLFRQLNGPTGPWLANALELRPLATWMCLLIVLVCLVSLLYGFVRLPRPLPRDNAEGT
ncbi:MAG: hypothetical protein K1Y02_00490 [Candidatus Hydrogenedentes bacterium]|nr:hypothetical protein [Candidatus Hydrogenedentota bacterium]